MCGALNIIHKSLLIYRMFFFYLANNYEESVTNQEEPDQPPTSKFIYRSFISELCKYDLELYSIITDKM